jgi:hypothetical protein
MPYFLPTAFAIAAKLRHLGIRNIRRSRWQLHGGLAGQPMVDCIGLVDPPGDRPQADEADMQPARGEAFRAR